METAATKNYLALSFGCLSPTRGEENLLDQIKKKHDLWNKLVEKEREHREKVRQAMVFESETTKKIKELEEELNSLREEIKKQRKTKRTGKVDLTDQKARIEEIKPQLKQLKEKFKEERSFIFEARKQELAQLEKERWAVVKELGKGSGLYWCNLEDVVNSYDIGRKKAKAAGGELRFHRWDGTGKVTVRFQKGLLVNEMFSCTNNLLQVDPVDKDAWHNPVRAIRRKKSRTRVRLRACSENKKPLFIELPVVLHREIPEDALIRTASVIREKVGMRYRYKLNLVLELLGENTNRILPALEGTAAIDLGWRTVKDGLRVAYLVDDKGHSEELILDNDVLHEFNKVKDLQSIRDNLFNETKAKLLELLKTLELPGQPPRTEVRGL